MMHKSRTSSGTRSALAPTGEPRGPVRKQAANTASASEWGNVSQATHSWIVLHVRSLTERTVAQRLSDAGFAALVPVERKYVRRSRYTRRREPRDYPLFPRYIFVGIGELDWREVLVDRDVVGILGKPECPYRLSGAEIAWIRHLSDEGAEISAMNIHHALRAGQWAQIAEGPMAGLAGYIDAIRGSRASVLMEMLGVWRAVEMPLEALEVA